MYTIPYTTAQILELTEIVTEAPAKRAATKDKAWNRLVVALEDAGLSVDAITAEPFEAAKAMLLGEPEAMNAPAAPVEEAPLPESKLAEKAAAANPDGPGMTRFRNSPSYQKIIEQTRAEAEAAAAPAPKAEPKKPAAKAAKAKGEKAAKRAAPVKIGEEQRITEVVENPKRPGTAAHARFACYRAGMTVSEFIAAVEAAGFTAANARADLSWDRRKGFITVYP